MSGDPSPALGTRMEKPIQVDDDDTEDVEPSEESAPPSEGVSEISPVDDTAKTSAGNDGVDLSSAKSNPITRSDESRRKRRDLTEQLEEEGEEEKGKKETAKAVADEVTEEQIDIEKILEERNVEVNEDGQYVDAEGVSL